MVHGRIEEALTYKQFIFRGAAVSNVTSTLRSSMRKFFGGKSFDENKDDDENDNDYGTVVAAATPTVAVGGGYFISDREDWGHPHVSTTIHCIRSGFSG